MNPATRNCYIFQSFHTKRIKASITSRAHCWKTTQMLLFASQYCPICVARSGHLWLRRFELSLLPKITSKQPVQIDSSAAWRRSSTSAKDFLLFCWFVCLFVSNNWKTTGANICETWWLCQRRTDQTLEGIQITRRTHDSFFVLMNVHNRQKSTSLSSRGIRVAQPPLWNIEHSGN